MLIFMVAFFIVCSMGFSPGKGSSDTRPRRIFVLWCILPFALGGVGLFFVRARMDTMVRDDRGWRGEHDSMFAFLGVLGLACCMAVPCGFATRMAASYQNENAHERALERGGASGAATMTVPIHKAARVCSLVGVLLHPVAFGVGIVWYLNYARSMTLYYVFMVLTFIVCSMNFVLQVRSSTFFKEPDLQSIKDSLKAAAREKDKRVAKLLRDGTIRLISVKWLVNSSSTLDRLVRCQDLPGDAFVDAKVASKRYINQEQFDVYVLSYGWLTPEHPDPEGFRLAMLRRFFSDVRLCPDIEHACLFWDFASLPQKERTGDEDSRFKRGLGAMGDFYGSMYCTKVIQIKTIPTAPAGVEYNTRPYDQRGWCCFEQAASEFAAYYGGKPNKLIELRWDSHASEQPISMVLPVIQTPSLASAKKKIEAASFTGKGDLDVVMKMLKEFNAVLSAASTTRGWKSRLCDCFCGCCPTVGERAPKVVPVSGE